MKNCYVRKRVVHNTAAAGVQRYFVLNLNIIQRYDFYSKHFLSLKYIFT